MVVGELVQTRLPDVLTDFQSVEKILLVLANPQLYGGRRGGDSVLTHNIKMFLRYHRRVPGGALIWREPQEDLEEMKAEYSCFESSKGGKVHGIAIPTTFDSLMEQQPAKQVEALITAAFVAWHLTLNDADIPSLPVSGGIEAALKVFRSRPVLAPGFEPGTSSM